MGLRNDLLLPNLPADQAFWLDGARGCGIALSRADRAANPRHLGPAAGFFSAADRPALPLLFSGVGIAVTIRAEAPAVGASSSTLQFHGHDLIFSSCPRNRQQATFRAHTGVAFSSRSDIVWASFRSLLRSRLETRVMGGWRGSDVIPKGCQSQLVNAKLLRIWATSGWSGPRAFSRMARDRLYSGSAAPYLPCA